MPIETKCPDCRGTGQRGWKEPFPCNTCKTTGVVVAYRTRLTQSQKKHHGWDSINGWPRIGKEGFCTVCSTPLTGRQRTFCSSRHCKGLFWKRLYEGIHWMKRHVCVRDGCACQMCGEKFESPLVEGGPIYPIPSMLELDHIVPIHKGGGENPENLQLLCRGCHKDKTKIDVRDIRSERKQSSNPTLPL